MLRGIELVTVATRSDFKRLSGLSDHHKPHFIFLGHIAIMRYIKYFIYWLGWLNTVSHYYWVKDSREQDTKQTLNHRFHFLNPRVNNFQSKLPSPLLTIHLKLGSVLLLPSARQIHFACRSCSGFAYKVASQASDAILCLLTSIWFCWQTLLSHKK